MTKRFTLVYQCGIANVFETMPRKEPKRILQGSFERCASFAEGAGAAGAIVRTMSCNVAGDCIHASWTEGVDATPFRDQARNVHCN